MGKHKNRTEQISDKLPRITAICHHGKEDSVATIKMLQELETAKKFQMFARGVEPRGKPEHNNITFDKKRGVELTLDDIRKSTLLIIHKSNLNILQRRFGRELVNTLQQKGLLIVRNGRECQHAEKNTSRVRKKVQSCCKDFNKLLLHTIKSDAIDENIDAQLFKNAQVQDSNWHYEKNMREQKRKGNRTKRRKRS